MSTLEKCPFVGKVKVQHDAKLFEFNDGTKYEVCFDCHKSRKV